MNTILRTDSYKLGHWNQYPSDTEGIYSYLEAREGATFPETVMFGLQPILRSLAGVTVTMDDVREAGDLALAHFGTDELFNWTGWTHIVKQHGGKLPVRIKAVPEGTPVPVGNVMMTVENTDPACYWLTNALESVLLHAWYPMTVATLSRSVKKQLAQDLATSADSDVGLGFMLHDFGYRGVSSDESAAIGGAAHIVNFLGTDTLLGMILARDEYGADLADLAFSVPATEHSVMTARGIQGEYEAIADLIEKHPAGILSVVADSYNIYDFVDALGTLFKGRITRREGKFVVRPDSTTDRHPTPAGLVVALLDKLWGYFGGTVNSKGYKVLDPHIGMLWGDGLEPHEINTVCKTAMGKGYSVENLVFGMGGGLLQKVNRDTQRFAFKASAIKRTGKPWVPVQKKPLDATKLSKPGRLKLIDVHRDAYKRNEELGYTGQTPTYKTVAEDDLAWLTDPDLLQTVFENGELVNETTFTEVRKRAAL